MTPRTHDRTPRAWLARNPWRRASTVLLRRTRRGAPASRTHRPRGWDRGGAAPPGRRTSRCGVGWRPRRARPGVGEHGRRLGRSWAVGIPRGEPFAHELVGERIDLAGDRAVVDCVTISEHVRSLRQRCAMRQQGPAVGRRTVEGVVRPCVEIDHDDLVVEALVRDVSVEDLDAGHGVRGYRVVERPGCTVIRSYRSEYASTHEVIEYP